VLAWSIIPANAALLSIVGVLLGVVSTLVGVGGFAIALKQLSAIKTETEAAAQAIESVQIKIASFDAAQECASARKLIHDIKANLLTPDWLEVLKGYEALIDSFLKLSHSNSSVGLEDREVLEKQTRDMAKFCEAIRRKLGKNDNAIMLKGQDMALRDFSDTMTKITFSVIKEIQT
jgi:hypothetical protein